MNTLATSIYNEIISDIESKVNYPINFPKRRSAVADVTEAQPAAAADETQSADFNTILLNYLNGTMDQDEINQAIEAAITTSAKRFDVEESLIRAVIKAESGYNPYAVSSAGAMGLMQLMPGTATSMGVADPYNIYQNVYGGTKLLYEMLLRFDGDESLALAAYNAGAGSVIKYDGIPPYEETQNYVPKVLEYKNQYLQEAYKNQNNNSQ